MTNPDSEVLSFLAKRRIWSDINYQLFNLVGATVQLSPQQWPIAYSLQPKLDPLLRSGCHAYAARFKDSTGLM